ncbi:type II toxin-antitoxin system VapC family toxin [Kiritimatiella glycovorans]|uniref:Uncharacterized protein n=1 Tax=Kiritimatiella glycovorans TaxID=1307763 RepID=A0A0G3EGD1_9BACT|nr:type II toxin-antitoxin system VapC family toxin [Kiritimatiella glycovorans]AKJ64467.1 hypothetical protein L21SP4_01219 [Kiritimatiella glycovorans]
MVSRVFFDTSTVVPLLIAEPYSEEALSVWKRTEERFAWRWLKVETEAALARRRAPMEAWENWGRAERALFWIELPDHQLEALCAFNRSLRLRAADAAHLFVMERLARAVPNVKLFTYDQEMRESAHALSLSQINV